MRAYFALTDAAGSAGTGVSPATFFFFTSLIFCEGGRNEREKERKRERERKREKARDGGGGGDQRERLQNFDENMEKSYEKAHNCFRVKIRSNSCNEILFI
jgi:hypothetical protein